MLRVDDIQVGMFVAITGRVVPEVTESYVDPYERALYGFAPRRPVAPDSTDPREGLPLLIRAVALPFAVVEQMNGKIERIDIRKVTLVRLTPQYVAFLWQEANKPGKKKVKRSDLERIETVTGRLSFPSMVREMMGLDTEHDSMSELIGKQVEAEIEIEEDTDREEDNGNVLDGTRAEDSKE